VKHIIEPYNYTFEGSHGRDSQVSAHKCNCGLIMHNKVEVQDHKIAVLWAEREATI
jgi:hypothetical protein